MPRRVTGASPLPSRRRRAARLAERFAELYPEVRTALAWGSPWELLVATVCSAQTTDEHVNKVMPELFARFPGPDALADADPEEVERIIFSTGFYRQKTRSIIALARAIAEDHDGVVPDDLDTLTTLPGVGRKTASVVLAEVWDRPAIAVDTHVKRVAHRLGLTEATDPVKVESDLRATIPQRHWSRLSMRMIQFGRDVCTARSPACPTCPLRSSCPWPGRD